ncbi:hypothetical protein ERO13_A01G022800v2 [Gossypium hirsutum]|uniref:Cilia- and flagella-associated protein 251 n=2 Tax=Gossypium TaxID=3633 RepID=A0ABM3C312_GOSHI|nr:cilia- and flagella-associated protein 251-like [Gossypium hirsutum]KAG4213005.1 hypothetical protein ERO13_A01G022800v2 [Gossypium hirsutum]TYI41517.1 hypothetical protein ES332_A01G032400v1 [Gossypium tomentosum]
MDSIKAKKVQAMKKYRKTQFLSHNFLHFVAVFGILILSSFWSINPSLCSSMKQFAIISLPCIWSSFFNPKCLFIVVNVIVVFLVGESGLVGSKVSPVRDVYDEYVERNRRVRGVSVSTTVPREVGDYKAMDSEEGKGGFDQTDEEEEEEKGLFEVKEVITSEAESGEEEQTREVEEEEGSFEVKDIITSKVDPLEEERTCEIKEEKGLIEVQETKTWKVEHGRSIVKDHQEIELPEFNKRVEEFIARVNKQRWMEAQLLVSCKV